MIDFSKPIRLTLCDSIKAILFLMLPNLFMLGMALISNTSRPVINFDYILPLIFFVFPYKPLKVVGVVCFLVAFGVDFLMLVMQLFPFMDMGGVIYLVPFLFNAPVLYKILIVIVFVYIFIIIFCLFKAGNYIEQVHLILLVFILVVVGYFTGHLRYHQRDVQFELFARNNFYFIKSQFKLYQESHEAGDVMARDKEPTFSPLTYSSASLLTWEKKEIKSNKILFVVNESWGETKNKLLQEAILKNILNQQQNFEYFNMGKFKFVGATVQGELRELCQEYVSGFALRFVAAEKFVNCLPNKLKKQGYQTIALHGASGQLYDRYAWYPKAGFNRILTAEYLIGKPTCHSFNGVCDYVLFEEVKNEFKTHDKLFLYWLTLTSHINYSKEDIFNHRLICETYGVSNETDICRNFKLQAQFFDGLAELIQQEEMQGVEVIVVGDHQPPVIYLGEAMKYLEENHVAYIHLKVKKK